MALTNIQSLAQLKEYAKSLALPWGSCLALSGNLGAGKTSFSKYFIADKLALDESTISSPTFGLVHIYEKSPYKIYHLDWYRLDNEAEVLQLGLDDMFGPNNIILIEWMDKFPQLLSQLATHILDFSIQDNGKRTLDFRVLSL